MKRRSFLAAVLAAGIAPAFVQSKNLMGLLVPHRFAGLGHDYVWNNRRTIALCSGENKLVRMQQEAIIDSRTQAFIFPTAPCHIGTVDSYAVFDKGKLLFDGIIANTIYVDTGDTVRLTLESAWNAENLTAVI